jgi:hypothetical protein
VLLCRRGQVLARSAQTQKSLLVGGVFSLYNNKARPDGRQQPGRQRRRRARGQEQRTGARAPTPWRGGCTSALRAAVGAPAAARQPRRLLCDELRQWPSGRRREPEPDGKPGQPRLGAEQDLFVQGAADCLDAERGQPRHGAEQDDVV